MQSIVSENPLMSRGLSRGQRFMYFASALSWFDSWRTFGLHLLPAVILLSGQSPVNAPMWQLLPAVLVVHVLSAAATKVMSPARYGVGDPPSSRTTPPSRAPASHRA